MDVKELLEVIAAEQHQIWGHWMKYLFSVCAEADDGSMLIPKEKVDRWQRQMYTPYTDLTKEEQESDRHQALKVLPALNNILLSLSHFIKRAEEAEIDLHDLRTAYDEQAKGGPWRDRTERAEAALAALRLENRQTWAEIVQAKANEDSKWDAATTAMRARAEQAEAALAEAQREAAKWNYEYLRVQQESAGYCADVVRADSPVAGFAGGAAVNELPEPKIGDMATVLVPDDERHINDLWWWDGAKCVITAIYEGRYRVITTDGYQGWFERRLLMLVNEKVQP